MIYLNCDNLNSKIVIPSPVSKGGVDNFILTGADGSMITAECTDISTAPLTYELVPRDGAGFDFSGVQPGEYNMTLRFGRTKVAELLVSLRTVSDVDVYYDEEKQVTRIPDYFIPYDNITGKPTFKTINGERIDNGPGNIVTAGADMEVVTIDKVITAQELIDTDWNGYIITLPELEANKYYVLNLTYPVQDENGDPIHSSINIEYKGIKTGASILEINQTREGYVAPEITIKFNNKDSRDDQPKFYNCTNSTYLQQPGNYPSLDIFNIGYGVVTRILSNADTIEGLSSKLNTLQRNIDRKAEFRNILTNNSQFIDFYDAESKISYYSDPITQEEQDFSLPYSRKSFYARFIFTAGLDLTNLHFINTDNSIDENVAVNPNTQYFAEFYFFYITYREKYRLQTTTLIPIGSASSGEGGVTPEQVQEIINQNTAGYQTAEQVEQTITGKDYATNTRVNEVEAKIPTDIVTTEQLNAVQATAESKTTMTEVEGKLTEYTPTANIKTVNGQSLTDGPGDIEIRGDITSAEVDQRIETAVTPRNLKAIDQTELATVEIPTAGVTEERVGQMINDNNTNYTPTANIKTVNGQSLTDGPGNIEISGELMVPFEEVLATYTGTDIIFFTEGGDPTTDLYIQNNHRYIVTFPDVSQGTEMGWDFPHMDRYDMLFKIPDEYNGATPVARWTENRYGAFTYQKGVWYLASCKNQTVVISQLEEGSGVTEERVGQMINDNNTNYTPTANIKTVNGQSLTDGPGNIEISGGEDLSNIEHFTPNYDGTWVYVNEYQGKNCIIDFPDLSNNGSILFFFGDSRYTCYFKIPETWNGGEAKDGMNPEKTTGPTQFIKNVWYKVENYPTYRTIDIMSENPNGGVSEDRVNQLIDERGYQISANIKTVNGQSLTDGPGNINIKEGYPNFEYRPNAELRLKHHPDFGEGFVTYDGVEEGKTYELVLDEESLIRENMILIPSREGINHRVVIDFSKINPTGIIKQYQVYDACGPDSMLYPGNVYIMDQVDSTNRVYASTVKTSDMTEERVNQIVDGKGYQTDAQVKATITSNPDGYAKTTDVDTKLSKKADSTRVDEVVASIPDTTEAWEFTLEDGSVITKNVYIQA